MAARTPEELDTLFGEAMGRGDVEAVIALYEPNAVFPGMQGDVRTGLDEIRQEIAPIAATKPTLHMKPTKVLTSGDIAVIYNSWRMTAPSEGSAVAVEVARRQDDGTWLFVIDDSLAFPGE